MGGLKPFSPVPKSAARGPEPGAPRFWRPGRQAVMTSRGETAMYPSLTRFPGDLFAEMEGLQRQVEQLLGWRGAPSSIRAAQRGAFPAINMGVTPEAVEIYAFASGIDPATLDVSVDKGVLSVSGERRTEGP